MIPNAYSVLNQTSIEVFMLKRAQEISVDRIGLIACGNIRLASNALLKTLEETNTGLAIKRTYIIIITHVINGTTIISLICFAMIASISRNDNFCFVFII